MLTASRDHGRALTEERTRNAAVVDTLRARVADAGTLIEKQRVTIAELKMRVSGLKGDKAYLRAEVDHRESVISSLRVTVRAREAELIALRDEPDAEVHTMPRRVFTEPEPAADATAHRRGPVDRRLTPHRGRPEDHRHRHGAAELRGRPPRRLTEPPGNPGRRSHNINRSSGREDVEQQRGGPAEVRGAVSGPGVGVEVLAQTGLLDQGDDVVEQRSPPARRGRGSAVLGRPARWCSARSARASSAGRRNADRSGR